MGRANVETGDAGGEQIRSGSLTFHYYTNSNLRVVTWSTHGLSYALVSPLSAFSRGACLVCHQNMPDHARFEPRASR